MGAQKEIDKLLQDLGEYAGNKAALDLYEGMRQASGNELDELMESFAILLRHQLCSVPAGNRNEELEIAI